VATAWKGDLAHARRARNGRREGSRDRRSRAGRASEIAAAFAAAKASPFRRDGAFADVQDVGDPQREAY
jgi:hypothetical protein